MAYDHPPTLQAILDRHVEAAPDEVAITLDASAAASALGRHMTYAELDELVSRTAAGFAALGVGRHDRVVAWLPNSLEWYAVHLAAARLGAVTIPLNTRFRRREFASIVRDADPAVVIVADGFLVLDLVDIAVAVVGELAEQDRPHLVVASMDAARPARAAGALEFEDLLDCGQEMIGRSRPDEPVVAFATSGTTGSPKLVLHTARAVARHVSCVARAIELAPGKTMLGALPLCGVFGYVGALAALAGRARCLLQPSFDPVSVVANAKMEGLTHIYGPDVMLGAILDHAHGSRDALSSWSFAAFADFSGAGVDTAGRLERELGIRPRGVYGASELFAFMTIQPAHAPATARAQSGGFVVDDAIAMRVVDPETGSLVGAAHAGELQVRGPNVTVGYLFDTARSSRAFTQDGWYRSGDLCQINDDGRLLFHARMEDSLRLGGFLVEPAEIEGVIDGHPDVRRSFVVGVELPGEGTVAVAFAEPEAERELDPEDVRRICARQLAAFKVPAAVIVTTDIPLVRGVNGDKVQRSKLREMAQDQVGKISGGAA